MFLFKTWTQTLKSFRLTLISFVLAITELCPYSKSVSKDSSVVINVVGAAKMQFILVGTGIRSVSTSEKVTLFYSLHCYIAGFSCFYLYSAIFLCAQDTNKQMFLFLFSPTNCICTEIEVVYLFLVIDIQNTFLDRIDFY